MIVPLMLMPIGVQIRVDATPLQLPEWQGSAEPGWGAIVFVLSLLKSGEVKFTAYFGATDCTKLGAIVTYWLDHGYGVTVEAL